MFPIPSNKPTDIMDPDFSEFKKWVRVMNVQPLHQGVVIPTEGAASEIISSVNHRINSYLYKSDGLIDYWLSPDEFYRARAGDCEDFAIAKYYALAELGLKAYEMELALVVRKADRILHMVLIIRSHGVYLDLDNRIRKISEASAYYEGVYAINHRGWRTITL